MRFEVKTTAKGFRVWCNKTQAWITKEIPQEQIANEICEDFNAMENMDFSSLGLPNFSKTQ